MYLSKKFFRMVLCVLLYCLTLLIPIFSHAADNNGTGIREKIYRCIQTELGYTKEDLILNNLINNDDGSWEFSFIVKNPEEMTNGLVTGKMNADGKLKSIEAPTTVSMFEWLNQEIRKSMFNYKDVYKLKQLWVSKLDCIPEEEQKQFDRLHEYNPILDFLRHDIVLPDENCITYEKAVQQSINYIEKIDGWTTEMTKHIGIICEVVHIPSDMDHPVYQFIYTVASNAEFQKAGWLHEGYTETDSKRIRDMRSEEKKVFGRNIPCALSVRIDALTGEQVGDIYLDTPPVEDYGFTAIILWK
ncbi:hypothetical protein JRC49_02285 [Clostridiales bacterium FE2011]|nr:hypothetical protein JRC49_02285 [Clostridiales bacterium FE2011]QTE75641.1 hypothetical protein JS518_07115 [Clostridiales bacterium FE2010]